jgi:hypothetical protein
LIQPQPVAAPVTVALRLSEPVNEVTVVGKPADTPSLKKALGEIHVLRHRD